MKSYYVSFNVIQPSFKVGRIGIRIKNTIDVRKQNLFFTGRKICSQKGNYLQYIKISVLL
jgi:hypothetical protein